MGRGQVLAYGGTFRDSLSEVAFIARFMSSPDCFVKHLYILVHCLDGPALRNAHAQHVLSLLAAVPSIHLVATVDNLLAPLVTALLFQTSVGAKKVLVFSFVSIRTRTTSPVDAETPLQISHEHS